MRFPSKTIVERIRREYPTGTRVELVQMDDPRHRLSAQREPSLEWMTPVPFSCDGTTDVD